MCKKNTKRFTRAKWKENEKSWNEMKAKIEVMQKLWCFPKKTKQKNWVRFSRLNARKGSETDPNGLHFASKREVFLKAPPAEEGWYWYHVWQLYLFKEMVCSAFDNYTSSKRGLEARLATTVYLFKERVGSALGNYTCRRGGLVAWQLHTCSGRMLVL